MSLDAVKSVDVAIKRIFSCFACGKKYRAEPEHFGKVMHCKHCQDKILLGDDNDERRVIEVWFSKRAHAEEDPIQRIARFIAKAQHHLDIAIYSLTHDALIEPIADAYRRGVQIRIVMDKAQSKNAWSDDERYRNLGVPLRLDGDAGLMHHKFAIRDRSMVLTGSFNWTDGALRRNRENFLIIRMPHIVESYQEEFERVWEAGEQE